MFLSIFFSVLISKKIACVMRHASFDVVWVLNMFGKRWRISKRDVRWIISKRDTLRTQVRKGETNVRELRIPSRPVRFGGDESYDGGVLFSASSASTMTRIVSIVVTDRSDDGWLTFAMIMSMMTQVTPIVGTHWSEDEMC